MKVILPLVLLIILLVFETNFKYNIKENFYFSEKKYLKFVSNINVGLSHHTSNLQSMMREAYSRNLILILPKFKLSGQHNRGKQLQSDLSKYYDYDNFTVNGTKIKILKDDSNIDKSQKIIIKDNLGNLSKSKKLIYDRNKTYKLNLPKSKDIVEIGNRISKKIGKYACVHVRRGDMLNLKKNLNIETKSKNILDKLSNFNIKKVYIMTDEKNLNVFNEVKDVYDTYFFTNFEELKSIDDNYFLYFVEKVIMENAEIRISTFKTNKDYYNDYLSEHKGFQ